MIRILKGVSGYRPDRSAFRYGVGTIVTELSQVERDLVMAGQAVYVNKQIDRPIAEPPENFAIVPEIRKEEVLKAVVKRGRKPKNV
jgi:hypothetical protein